MAPPLLQSASIPLRPSILRQSILLQHASPRAFSSTPALSKRKRITTQRKRMIAWLNGPGEVFRLPRRGSTNYISAYDKEGNLIRAMGNEEEGGEQKADEKGDKKDAGADASKGRDAPEKEVKKEIPPETLEDLQPFPLNPFFRSPPVLSEAFRAEIYNRVTERGQSIRQVSQDMHVDMKRVAAVVRLQQVEMDWLRDNKPLALSFQKTMLNMLPQTPLNIDPDTKPKDRPKHESINDLPVHQSTLPQLFHPAPESQHFTRRDAGKAFHRGLLPADDRIPHPDMIQSQREYDRGMPAPARLQAKQERWAEEERLVQEREAEARRKKEEHETFVRGKRWDFRFERVHADKRAVGWRYGQPLEDRKKGQVKLPRRVD